MKQSYLSFVKRLTAALLAFIICMIAVPNLDFAAMKASADSVYINKGYQSFTHTYTYWDTNVTAKLSGGAPSGVSFTTSKGRWSTDFTVTCKYSNVSNYDKIFSLYIMKNNKIVREVLFSQAAPVCKININTAQEIKPYKNGNLSFTVTANGPVKIFSIYKNTATFFTSWSTRSFGSYKDNGSTYSKTVTISFDDNYLDRTRFEVWGIQCHNQVISLNLNQTNVHTYSNGKITIKGKTNRFGGDDQIWTSTSTQFVGLPLIYGKKANISTDGILIHRISSDKAEAYLKYTLRDKYRDDDDYEIALELYPENDPDYPGLKWRKIADIEYDSSQKMIWYLAGYDKTSDPSLSDRVYSTTFNEIKQ